MPMRRSLRARSILLAVLAVLTVACSQRGATLTGPPDTEPGLENFLKLNADLAKVWPNITQKKEPPADAKAWEGVPNKLEAHFSPNPGTGD